MNERHFQFGYTDLHKITGMWLKAIYQHKTRGNFDPENLESIVCWVIRHGTEEFRDKILGYAYAARAARVSGP